MDEIRIAQTRYARLLYGALKKRGVDSITEYWDGHKSIDIAIPGKLYIEVDGVQHLNDPVQIITDFKRAYYSERDDGMFTLHIHNDDIKHHLNSIADAICEVVNTERLRLAK